MTAFSVSIDGVIDTYTKLKDAITEETDGRANSAALDRFIKQAEGEIQVFLARNPLRPMRARTTLTLTSEYWIAPTDMVLPISAEVDGGSGLFRLPYVANINLSQMQAKSLPDNTPYAFTREGAELRFYPAPTSTYNGTLFYYEQLPGISEANTSNWLLAQFPHVYLAGALYYAYRDMPDIEKATLMKGIFDESLERLAGAYPEPDNEVTLAVEIDLLGYNRRWSWG